MAEEKPQAKKKKEKRKVPSSGVAHIQATFNNTIVSIADPQGGLIARASAGNCGFKGTKKGTPFAGSSAAENAAEKVLESGVREVNVMVNGPGARRETAIRALQAAGLEVI